MLAALYAPASVALASAAGQTSLLYVCGSPTAACPPGAQAVVVTAFALYGLRVTIGIPRPDTRTAGRDASPAGTTTHKETDR